MEARAAEQGLDNITSILGELHDPKLPAGKVDLILCVDVYHEFSHPEPMLAAMKNALTDDGTIVLVEFRAEDPNVPIKRLHKMNKQQINKEMNANQLFCFRPVPGWADHRTPITGLYLAGAASHPGGGVMGACGKNAAEEILRDGRWL